MLFCAFTMSLFLILLLAQKSIEQLIINNTLSGLPLIIHITLPLSYAKNIVKGRRNNRYLVFLFVIVLKSAHSLSGSDIFAQKKPSPRKTRGCCFYGHSPYSSRYAWKRVSWSANRVSCYLRFFFVANSSASGILNWSPSLSSSS